jgi:TatD DNase family protein
VLVDTHAHLNMAKFDDDRERVVQRAHEADVHFILDVGIDLKASRLAVQNAETYDVVYAAAGIHPHDASKMGPSDLREINELLCHPKVVALGEIGLDYHYDFSPRPKQADVFRQQLRLAQARKMAVIIHIREAMEDGLAILDEIGPLPGGGVFHCFGGDADDADHVLERGFYISFTGVVTFRNFKMQAAVRAIPLDRLLLETDAPYMAPVPLRGKRCEPCFIGHTARVMADILAISESRLADATSENAARLFGWEG